MKKIVFKSKFAFTLAIISLFAAAVARGRAGKQDFVLRNETGVEIHELYVSPHESDDWQANILGRATLPSGESVKVTFDDREKHVHWDMKIVDSNGNSLEWEDLNLVEISQVTLHWDAKKSKGWAEVKK